MQGSETVYSGRSAASWPARLTQSAMPKFLRIFLTGAAFAGFFLFGGLVGRILLPVLAALPGTPEKRQRRVRRLVTRVYRTFIVLLRLWRLIDYRRPALPPDFPVGRPYVLISNHPSLIDTLILMGLAEELTSVVKASWLRSWLISPLLTHAGHIAGPEKQAALPSGAAGEDMSSETEAESAAVLARMVAHLQAGNPMVIFPEGTRSQERKLRRFRRGAVEAAVRAEVPIVPVFISVDPPMLMKGQPWYEVPESRGVYRLEFFPVIETAGRGLDPRALNRELRAMYEQRFSQMLRERDREARPAAAPRGLPETGVRSP